MLLNKYTEDIVVLCKPSKESFDMEAKYLLENGYFTNSKKRNITYRDGHCDIIQTFTKVK